MAGGQEPLEMALDAGSGAEQRRHELWRLAERGMELGRLVCVSWYQDGGVHLSISPMED